LHSNRLGLSGRRALGLRELQRSRDKKPSVIARSASVLPAPLRFKKKQTAATPRTHAQLAPALEHILTRSQPPTEAVRPRLHGLLADLGPAPSEADITAQRS
jgi:hypothetical protein